MSDIEYNRVEALRALNILDTPPESDFDELAQLASMICETPIALISLVDTNRQWFKAKIGLDINETPREISFCTKTIEQKNTLIVSDASKDPLFANNPLVTSSPQIRFYAGAPLTSSQGFAIGTLCVIDSRPRPITPAQVRALQILAKQVMNQIEIRQLNRDLHCSLNSLNEKKFQIKETQKLSSLGEMAGGLAHEINNPLAIIYGRAIHLQEMASSSAVSPSEVHRHVSSIIEVTERLMRIIKGLRNFSRSGDQDPKEPVDLNEIVKDTLEFCRQKIKEANVRLTIKDPNPNAIAFCRPVQISQVILNLLNNSFDAIKNTQQPWIEIEVLKNEQEVSVSVMDSGAGVKKELQENLFKPFFTTKPPQQGTGLGLSISRKIAQDNGGDLSYDFTSPHTRFKLVLPDLSRRAKE